MCPNCTDISCCLFSLVFGPQTLNQNVAFLYGNQRAFSVMKQFTLLLGVFTRYLMACQLLAGPSTRAKMGTSNGRLHALLVLFLFRQLLELCWCLVSVFCKLDRYSLCACDEMVGSRQASCPPEDILPPIWHNSVV